MTAVRRLDNESLYVPISTGQYHAMLREGIIDDGAPVELLEGLIVPKDRAGHGEDPMGHNPLHRAVVSLIHALTGRIDSDERFLQVQLPVDLAPDSEPEPDGAVIRGRRRDYVERLPSASDVYCVIEAASSSLLRDSGTKKRIYASAGIPQYVLVNLQSLEVEVYQQPHDGEYLSGARHPRGTTFELRIGPGVSITVEATDLLPTTL